MRINFTGVSMETFALLEPGEYILRVNKTEEKRSKKGNEMVEVEFEEEQSGAKVRDWFVNGEASLPKLKSFLSDIGQPFEGDVEVSPFKWVGERVLSKVVIDTYTKDDGTEGKSNKIKSYKKFSGLPNHQAQVDALADAVNPLEDEVPF